MRRFSGRVRTAEKPLPTGTCEVCGGAYAATPGKRRRFCSASCRRRHARLLRVAEWQELRARLDRLIERS